MTLKTIFASGAALAVIAAVAVSPAFVSAHNDGKSDKTQSSGTTVAIGNNGGVLVRGAEVTAISNGVVTARTIWGDTNIAWAVDTNGDTDFIDLGGDGSNLDELEVGDTISFSGSIDSDSGAFSVDADVVRNWSEGEKHDNRSLNAEVKAEVNSKDFWKDLGTKIKAGFGWGHR